MSTRQLRLQWMALLLVLASLPTAVDGQNDKPERPAARQARLSGRVVDVAGTPVGGATVRLLVGTSEIRRLVAGDDGLFAIEGVPSGEYLVAASSPGFSEARTQVGLDGAHQDVSLVLGAHPYAEVVSVFGARLSPTEAARRQWPGAVDVLTADVLESSHVFSTSEALRKVPGVSVRDEEGIGLRPNIAVRGLNPTRSSKVLLLEDGIATTYAPYGDNASYYHPPIDRFERVEVMKGASQIAHGPVTVGAVINYITPEPPQRPALTLGLAGGNRGFVDGRVGVGGTARGTGVLVSAMHKQSDGARDNVSSRLEDVNVKVTRQLAPLHSLSGKLSRYQEDSQVTYSGLRAAEFAANPRQNPFANDRFDGVRIGGSLSHRGVVAERFLVTTTGYGATFERDWWRQSSQSNQRPNDSADPACGGMDNLLTTCGNEGRLRRYRSGGVETRAHMALGSGRVGHAFDAGARFHVERQERLQLNGSTPVARGGVTVEDNHRRTEAWSGFLLHQLRWGGLTVAPGVRVEHVRYGRLNRLLGVGGQTQITEVLPGVGVTLATSAGSAVFAGAHRGFAPPRAEDVISNTTGSVVDLEPERGWNFELGARAHVRQGLGVDVTAFRLAYENQIVPASVAGGLGAALTNGGRTIHQGLELAVTADSDVAGRRAYAAYARAALTWVPTADFAGTRFSSVPGFSSSSVAGNRIPYAPVSTSTVTIGLRHRRGLDAQLESQYVGDQFGDDLNTVPASADGQRGLLPAFTYWNGAITWRVAHGGSVFLTVKNLLDRTFIVDRARGMLPGMPRLVQVGSTWRF